MNTNDRSDGLTNKKKEISIKNDTRNPAVIINNLFFASKVTIAIYLVYLRH
jgi:hypothetical protein